MNFSVESDRIIRIFVGKGDYNDQNKLARRREKQGWIVGSWDGDEQIESAMPKVEGSIVVLNGGSAADCLPKLAHRVLTNNAKFVVVPLEHVRGGEIWNPKFPLHQRAKVMAQVLERLGSVHDTRLIVRPLYAWLYGKKFVA